MTSPQPEAPATAPEERIGKYRVHPVAAMFPMLEGAAYEELKKSIADHGQQEPIIVTMDDVLIDGRNRVKALHELGRSAVFQLFNQVSRLPVEEFILVKNLFRRHLTDDQRMMITTQVMLQQEAEAARARQRDNKGGRGKKAPKNLTANSTQGLREPTVTEKIAATAKTTDHQARQAVAVAKHAPELVEPVKSGEVSLKAAAKVAQSRHQPAKRAEPHQPEGHFDADRVYQRIQAMIESCPKKHLAEFMKRLYRATEPVLWQWLKPGDVLIANNQTAFIANVARRREKASNNKWPFGAGELIMEAVECLISDLSIQQRAELRGKEW
jgi:ParB-like chromosome segregation protein Spo0J